MAVSNSHDLTGANNMSEASTCEHKRDSQSRKKGNNTL